MEEEKAARSKSGPTATTKLPDTFKPGPHDVICGKTGLQSYHSIGNRRFRVLISLFVTHYRKATTKSNKSWVVINIIDTIHAHGGSFIKLDRASGRWYEIGRRLAKDKVGHALRNALAGSVVQHSINPTSTTVPTTVAATTSHNDSDNRTDDRSANGDSGDDTTRPVLHNKTLLTVKALMEMDSEGIKMVESLHFRSGLGSHGPAQRQRSISSVSSEDEKCRNSSVGSMSESESRSVPRPGPVPVPVPVPGPRPSASVRCTATTTTTTRSARLKTAREDGYTQDTCICGYCKDEDGRPLPQQRNSALDNDEDDSDSKHPFVMTNSTTVMDDGVDAVEEETATAPSWFTNSNTLAGDTNMDTDAVANRDRPLQERALRIQQMDKKILQLKASIASIMKSVIDPHTTPPSGGLSIHGGSSGTAAAPSLTRTADVSQGPTPDIPQQMVMSPILGQPTGLSIEQQEDLDRRGNMTTETWCLPTKTDVNTHCGPTMDATNHSEQKCMARMVQVPQPQLQLQSQSTSFGPDTAIANRSHWMHPTDQDPPKLPKNDNSRSSNSDTNSNHSHFDFDLDFGSDSDNKNEETGDTNGENEG